MPAPQNILFLLADQHRTDCIASYGNPIVQTPNLDALAARGIRFTNAFTPAAICTPARACIQTGLAPRKHGLIFNTEFHRCRGGEINLLPNTRGFAHDLHDAGWNLAHIGKWHIGDTDKPADFGYRGIHYPGYGYPSNHPHYLAYLQSLGVDGFHIDRECRDPSGKTQYYARQVGPPEASIPHYLAHQTIETIEQFANAGKPFFISCNFWGPHAPFRIPDPYFSMYDAADIPPWPNFNADLSHKPAIVRRQGDIFQMHWVQPHDLRLMLARHYGYVTLIDQQIGRILDALRQAGQLENTLILYAADHGSADGAFRMWDKGFGMYDNLWRVPLIASHPAFTPAVNDDFVDLLDLAPTFLEIANCTPRPELDGRSLLPLLNGRPQYPPRTHIVREAYGHQFPCWQRMIRTSTEKYVFTPSDTDEFYDLKTDPWEVDNLIDELPQSRLEPFREILRQHVEQTNDPIRSATRWLL